MVVLRGQVFAGDALSHVAFTGALAALAFGVDLRLGLYGGCVAFALLLAVLGRRTGADDTVIGSVFAWVLGLGALFLSLFTTSSSGSRGVGGHDRGQRAVRLDPRTVPGAGLGRRRGVAGRGRRRWWPMARPLVFASLDPAVAASRGVPVRALSYGFFVLLGVTAGVATQAVGALLLLGLLAAPAGAAQRLTARPFRALWLSAGIAVGSMWAGLTVAYLVPTVPPSFGILGVATGGLPGDVRLDRDPRRRAGRRGGPGGDGPRPPGSGSRVRGPVTRPSRRRAPPAHPVVCPA